MRLAYLARTFLFLLQGGRPYRFLFSILKALSFPAASRISVPAGTENTLLPLCGLANTEYVAGGSLRPRFDSPVIYSITSFRILQDIIIMAYVSCKGFQLADQKWQATLCSDFQPDGPDDFVYQVQNL
jgi:hypothetical protein